MKKIHIFPKGKKIIGTRLTPVEVVSTRHGLAYKCKCTCGNTTVQQGYSLKSGAVKSCGCYKIESTRKRATTHGLSKTKEYFASFAAHSRCNVKTDSRYPDYGGRGIKFEFKSVEDMTMWLISNMPRPKSGRWMLDRKDNDAGYNRRNLKWSTPSQSMWNRRTTRIVTIGGISKPLTAWACDIGISPPALSYRLEQNWPEKLLLSKEQLTPMKRAQILYET